MNRASLHTNSVYVKEDNRSIGKLIGTRWSQSTVLVCTVHKAIFKAYEYTYV